MSFVDSKQGICTPSSKVGELDGSSVHEASSQSSDEDTSTSKLFGVSDGNDGNDNTSPINEMSKYAANENKLVNRWRLIVIVSILVVGAIVCSMTYTTLKRAQVADGKDAYESFANTINDSFQFRVKAIFDANRALSKAITLAANEHNHTFPFYTVHNFEARAYEARKLAAFETISYAPIVSDQEKWINFTQTAHGWLDESKRLYDFLHPGTNRSLEPPAPQWPPYVYVRSNGTIVPRKPGGTFVPRFMVSPPPILTAKPYANFDLYGVADLKSVSAAAVLLKDAVFSKYNVSYSRGVQNIIGDEEAQNNHQDHPHSVSAQPVYDTLDPSTKKVVAYVFSTFAWNYYLNYLLPDGVNGIHVVFYNSCNQTVTYQLNGIKAILLGEGDLHDRYYDSQKRTIDFASNYFDPSLAWEIDGHCQYFLDVYPTDLFKTKYYTPLPIVFTVVIGILFIFMAVIFAVYDRFVHTRNTKVVGAAARSDAIVSSLFPEAIRDRLMEQQEQDAKSRNLRGFLTTDKSTEWNKDTKSLLFETKPIADLFPETTILFADIVNFTAWSSVRDPSQVFTLLEVIYNAFDEIARKRGVFKVETIGDCYVAVCGLPEPTKDHALRMSRFAKDCMNKMRTLVKMLESTLGPDTGDLSMRMGLHSGPVTAGVLRGERSRFQLFGDTMNTAARMESTGFANCIQISKTTADLLIAAGKQSWLKPRSDMVNAKGKGLMQTYMLEMSRNAANSHSGSSSGDESTTPHDNVDELTEWKDAHDFLTNKDARLVDWIAELLIPFLKEIAVRRCNSTNTMGNISPDDLLVDSNIGNSVLGEVKEIITLPGITNNAHFNNTSKNDSDIDPLVVKQLREYLSKIASMYPENPFHNFEHASHVTMSVQKLLARIISPSDLDRAYETKSLGSDNTYGITSDPLTQFSCLFSAVIHDVDHPGVPNVTLIAEKVPLATKYNNKSVAEQNSVDLAWNLLMKDEYKTLRAAIYQNNDELLRFRQLVVNSVMATDIADKDQKVFRNARWDRAFHEKVDETEQDSINRKATIVIEHLIQASDVAHTMQHWHIYRKWNQRFFEECYRAYKMGRSQTDPSLSWYEGEIGFFDFYIIPLAKKLKECGVFGVSSDEYLNYAMQNRNEWKDRGQELVSEMIESVCNKMDTVTTARPFNSEGESNMLEV